MASVNILTTVSRNTGIAFIVASAACYGAMPIFARYAYSSGVSPVTLLFLRFAFASPVMLALVALRRVRFPRGAALLALIGLGGVIYVLQALCYFTALTRAPASLVALILYLYPILVAIGAVIIYGERFTIASGIALVLALGGAAMMIGLEKGGSAAGIILAMAAAAIYAVYILTGTRVMRTVPSLAAAAVVICSTAVVYGGLAAVRGPAWPTNAAGWVSIAALALVSTVAAIALFFAGLERVGPTTASILSTLEPAVAVALAAILLGEALTLAKIAGGTLILGAVFVTARAGARRKAPA
ncbi:MAG TPA: DMT family transporter [Spirochaetia bacterium]|nr:DMT family transporter [Spirochaetia bacterium]